MIGFGIMLALAGIIVLIAGVAQAAQNRTYAACSETVTGTVTRKQSRNVKNGKSHELTVSYTVDGVDYKKVVGVLLTKYNATNEGDKLELCYKPNNPKKSVYPRELKPKNVKIVLVTGAILIVAGIILFLIGKM